MENCVSTKLRHMESNNCRIDKIFNFLCVTWNRLLRYLIISVLFVNSSESRLIEIRAFEKVVFIQRSGSLSIDALTPKHFKIIIIKRERIKLKSVIWLRDLHNESFK